MPFLAHLQEQQEYQLHSFYSGLPSSTPAVQGELHYGVKTAVPAFGYRDRSTDEYMEMYDSDSAEALEKQLREKGEPLLDGGSSYCNVYTGGAREAHFCMSTMGLDDLHRKASPWAYFVAMCLHGYSLLRMIVFTVIETGVAVRDYFHGVSKGHDFRSELKFIPARLAVCVLLRELITIGAKIDVARGLPVIHVNFLGYDEQAHRRGPTSRFAHWSLKGIDDAIARIYRAAQRSNRRDYDVWIFSDHGQEEVRPYSEVAGRTVQQTVRELTEPGKDTQTPTTGYFGGIQLRRARVLARRLQRAVREAKERMRSSQTQPNTIAVGPLGHIYLKDTDEVDRKKLAASLSDEGKLPAVFVPDRGDANRTELHGYVRGQAVTLPEDWPQVLGQNHPFGRPVAADFVELCHHPNAGDLVFSGWSPHEPALSFPIENGAHAGFGSDETHGFTLLPADAPMEPAQADATSGAASHVRPMDLRNMVFTHLGRTPTKESAHPKESPDSGSSMRQDNTMRIKSLRIMTYNVHGCVGMDGKLSPRRIARVIAQLQPDIVALQEVDVNRKRSGHLDQAEQIGRELKMEHHFHPSMQLAEERYGDAILSRWPMQIVQAGALPTLNRTPQLEPRGALWVSIQRERDHLNIINTHFGLRRLEKLAQARAMLGEDWLGKVDVDAPLILCGDFNAGPRSPTYRMIAAEMNDTQICCPQHRPLNTWFSRQPVARIDHILTRGPIRVRAIHRRVTDLARVASDHLPLLAELEITEPALQSESGYTSPSLASASS
jgi:endonuclease/exonuclease/phosphatase family metal-dependent hydrolase